MDSSQTYLFIDGGYLDRTLAAHSDHFFGTKLKLNLGYLGGRALKCFYYDAYPSQKNGEPDADFKTRLSETEKKFNYLSSHAGWHVNPGFTRGSGKKMRQKGVDVQLAVDALTHSAARNCRWVILLTGDLDFLPLVRALVQEGVYVTLWHDPRSSSKDLVREADSHELFGVRKVYGILEPKPNLSPPEWVNCPQHQLKRGATIYKGETDAGNIELKETPPGFAANLSANDERHRFLEFHDLNKLKYFVETEFTELKWTEPANA